jgi:TRAP-type transport system periplasmic protein
MSTSNPTRRQTLTGLNALAWGTATGALSALVALPASAQTRLPLRISSPAVPDDWHGKMWTVLKEQLDKSAPGEFDVQINLNGSLFKQGAEPTAMARGNLELATVSPSDIAKLIPEFSIFTAGYVLKDPAHQQKVLGGPIGDDLYKLVSDKMDMTVLSPLYLGTRQLNLREPKTIKIPADLKGIKLRMPASKDWLFLGEALGATATPLAFGEVYLGLKTGTIDAQDNPLPTVRAAKFYEVTKQLVLTSHLVDCLFIAVSNKAWNALSPVNKQKLKAAAVSAAQFNNDNRIKEEAQIVEFFKQQGLTVSTPDLDAFRQHVQQAYLKSDAARHWPAGLIEKINATR